MGTTLPRRFTAEAAEIAERFLLCALCVLGGFSSVTAAVPPVRTMYTETLGREQNVRNAMNASDAPQSVLADVRAVVAAYESLVAHYPASGYSDNALWQAGRLSIDAFLQFGQPRDRDAGQRLLRRLQSGYPTSRLVKQVPDQLARLNGAPAPATAPVAVATAAPIAPAPARDTRDAKDGRIATIKDIRRSVLPGIVRITIELDAEVPFHDERIADPDRVFVDLPGTRAAPALIDRTLRFESDADIVRQVRIGRHPNNTTRVVLDAAGITSYSVYPLYAPYRLVIDCLRTSDAVSATAPSTAPAAPKALASRSPVPAVKAPARLLAGLNPSGAVPPPPQPPAPLSTHRLPPEGLRPPPGMTPRAAQLIADAFAAAAATPNPVVTPTALPAPPLPAAPKVDSPAPALAATPMRNAAAAPAPPPSKNSTGGLSISRQLGLGVSRIVIDAGHGGHDPGAKGKGVTEAELVLDVALRLEKLLQKIPGVEVILTRRTDDFIELPERTAIANREGADLFLSIHANASANAQAHGIETYFLNFANNQSAAAVAARENAASTQAMGGLPDFVKAIATNNKLDESREFAADVQRAMVERQKSANKLLKDLGVKQAPFVVLIGANMPSVLAEMGFVTNPQEAKLLKSNAYRQKIAEALFNAIRKYQTSLKSTTTVALQ